MGQDILTSFHPIHKLFGFSERGDNSVCMYYSFFENFDLGRRGSLSKIPLFWRLKPYFSMKESSDWVENIHLGQFEYEEFKNELTKKKYWRLPDKLFIKLSNTRKTSHIQLGQDISTSFNPIPKLFGFSERGDNSVGMYFSFFENFDLGRRGSLSKIHFLKT